MADWEAADAREISSSITAIANEKLKLEKEANAGKEKQGTKKKQVLVDRAEEDYSATRGYDDVETSCESSSRFSSL